MYQSLNAQSSSLNTHLNLIIECCKAEPDEKIIKTLLKSNFPTLQDELISAQERDTSLLNAQHFKVNWAEPKRGTTWVATLHANSWQSFIDLAYTHGVLPLVYFALKKQKELIPEEAQQELKDLYTDTAKRNMLMTAELIKVMKLLEKNGIEALAFKGPILAQQAYDDITLRYYGDLDVLIHKKDITKAMVLLEEDNYSTDIKLQKAIIETFYNCVNVMGLYKESSSIRLEVHWELLSKNYAITWEEKALWEDIDTTYINNIPINTLAFDNHVLYLCIHGAKHFFDRLEWVCDIDRSLRSQPTIDWQRLLEKAESLGAQRMLFLGLSLSKQFFDSKLPEFIEEKIDSDPSLEKLCAHIAATEYSTTQESKKTYGSFFVLWRMREHFSDKMNFAYKALFAPKYDDFRLVQLPKQLLFLYSILRPIRLFISYFQKKS